MYISDTSEPMPQEWLDCVKLLSQCSRQQFCDDYKGMSFAKQGNNDNIFLYQPTARLETGGYFTDEIFKRVLLIEI